jgi:hypothetical protein
MTSTTAMTCPRCTGRLLRDSTEDDGTLSCVVCGNRVYPGRVRAYAAAALREFDARRRAGPRLRGNGRDAA